MHACGSVNDDMQLTSKAISDLAVVCIVCSISILLLLSELLKFRSKHHHAILETRIAAWLFSRDCI